MAPTSLPPRTLLALAVAVALLAVGASLYKPAATGLLLSSPSSSSASALAAQAFVDQIVSAHPSRSSSYPFNILPNQDQVNELGQRPVNNSVPSVRFFLAENGVGNSTGLALQTGDFADVDHVIAQHCCTPALLEHHFMPVVVSGEQKNKKKKAEEALVGMAASRCAPNSGARLVSDTGVRVLSFNDVEQGQRVYCVPQGVHFVWPLHHVGKAFYPKNVVGPIPDHPIKLVQLSQQPRVFSVSNFVSPEEIEELMRTNLNRLTPSEVGFGGWQDDTRTSTTSWDERSKASQSIQRRTFEILGMDYNPQLADTLQVLRYGSEGGAGGGGQWYKPHTDWFDESSYDGHDPRSNNGSNRFATMFLYLSDVAEGGATVFPHSTTHEGYNGEKIVHDGTIDTPSYINTGEAKRACQKNSTALKTYPIQGHAVLFYNQGPYGELDAYSLHGGCPPIAGTKMSANVWVWNRKSPPKSSAKDKNVPKEKLEGQIAITFTNGAGQLLEVFWDSQTPTLPAGTQPDLDYFTQQFASNAARFVSQGELKAGRMMELSSYKGHVFAVLNQETSKVVRVVTVTTQEEAEFMLE